MPIEFKRSGDTCEKCNKPNTEVGKISYYTDPHDGYKGLLCSECIKRREKPYTERCPKCKRLAYKHGGMSLYDTSPESEKDPQVEKAPEDYEYMCLECVEKKEKEVAKRNAMKLKIKNFAKDHWKFWIMATIGILGLIVALSRL